MSINLEQIETLRERANVSYEEAKDALEKSNYDVVEALIYLEKQNRVNGSNKSTNEYGFFAAVRNLIKKGNEIKFLLKKNEINIINLPLTVVVIFTIAMPPVMLVGLLVALITNHKIRFEKPDGGEMKINETFDKMSTAVVSASSQVVDAFNKNQQ